MKGGEEKEKGSGNGCCGGGGRDGGGFNERELVPRKFARTDSYPLKMPSFPSSTENGPTFYGSGDLYDATESTVAGAAARTVQPFACAFKSPGMASLRFPFTPAQRQELEQQALICKYLMAAVPIPPDLVIHIRKSLENAAPIINNPRSNLGWGSFNLRFSGSSDPEPGRCRRTDGKKWRCSVDVAPDQKYCERHMHRGRSRSRKPVEVQVQTNASASSHTITSSISIPNSSSTTSTLCRVPSNLGTKSYNPSGSFTKSSSSTDFKLPLQTPVQDKCSSRYLNFIEGGIPDAANHQWQLYHSKLGATQQISRPGSNVNTSILNYQNYMNLLSEPLDLRGNIQQNDHQGCHFLNTDLGSLEPDSTQKPQHSIGLIEAWSQARGSSCSQSLVGNKASLSSLTLSMSSGEDMDVIRMGLGAVNDSGRDSPAIVKPPQPFNWMIPVSWQSPTLGGPLAEVLQSSTTAATSSPKGCTDKSWYGGGDGAGLNLTSNAWGEVSPRDSPRLLSSPTGVLHKTLASLSDSSSGSSPKFAAKSEIALQWLNQPHN